MNHFHKKSLFLFAAVLIFSAGCNSNYEKFTESAAGKNLDISGYFMQGKVEAVSPETSTPIGKFILGRINYKSRLIAVGKDKQIPTAGAFRAVQSVSVFGTRETVIEYDFTAADPQTAANIVQALEQQKCSAEKQFAQ